MSVRAIGSTLRTARELRAYSTEALIREESQACARYFRANHYGRIPVLICARDEEADLPATLVALARSTQPVHPIVIDNNSTDRTADFAHEFGATVLEEQVVGKAAALQTGLDYVTTELDHTLLLATDADTIVGEQWAKTMLDATARLGIDGGIVFGGVVAQGGASGITDMTRSVLLNAKQMVNTLAGRHVGARGANVGLNVTPSFHAAIDAIPPETFPGHDRALASAAETAGARVAVTFAGESYVSTLGDRYCSLGQYVTTAVGITPLETIY